MRRVAGVVLVGLLSGRAFVGPRRALVVARRTRLADSSTDVEGFGVRIHAYEGRIALQWGVKYRREDAATVAPEALELRESPGKGRGVFAARAVAEGTFLGSYDGDVLTAEAYEARYSGGGATPEYVVRVDSDCYIDGARAAEGDAYTPALFNDGGARANVVRFCATRRPPRVDFFASRDIGAGEELLFDYGPQYWAGRDDAPVDAGAADEATAFDLDAQFFDPDEKRDEGAVREKLKALFRSDPETFEAFYGAAVIAVGVAIGQAVVRWYKYNVWLPQGPADLSQTLSDFSDAL